MASFWGGPRAHPSKSPSISKRASCSSWRPPTWTSWRRARRAIWNLCRDRDPDEPSLQVVRGGHAVVDRVLQLRGPPGDLFGFSAARKGNGSHAAAVGPARFLVRGGIWHFFAVRGHCGGPGAAQIGHFGRAVRVERYLHGDGGLAQSDHTAGVPRGRRAGRDVLLSGVHVAAERLSWS